MSWPMFLVGQKAGNVLLEYTTRISPEWTLDDSTWPNGKLLQGLRNATVETRGGSIADYSFFQCSEAQRDRILNGDEFDVTWTLDNITGLDFDLEDNKKWAKFFVLNQAGGVPKDELIADGVDSIYVRIELWNKDMSAISPANVTRKLPIIAGGKKRYVNVTLVNGIFERVFKTTKESLLGTLIIPSDLKRYNSVRIDPANGQKRVEIIENEIDFWT